VNNSFFFDGADYWNNNVSIQQTMAVGSLTNCVTSAAGYSCVFDLSGNVWEWEDSCDRTEQSNYCRIRGGSFGNGSSYYLTCRYDYTHVLGLRRDFVNADVGFRCCTP
jgi:formylglycine-generating enzyme